MIRIDPDPVCWTGVRASRPRGSRTPRTITLTQIEWYSKEEAGVRLGTQERPLSARRVLELAKEGRIQSDRIRDPKTNQMSVRIHAGSVERYIDGRKVTVPCEVREVREPRTPQSFSSQLAARTADLAQPARLWLTLQEAVEYSGLPADVLRAFISIGNLPALDIGPRRRGGRWRIRRVDLERLEAIQITQYGITQCGKDGL